MSLDLVALSRQARSFTETFVARADDLQQRCDDARHRYLDEADAYETWARLAESSCPSMPFLLARPLEALDRVYNLPPCPDAYALVATDGSQVEVDRHGVAPFGLVNVGRVFLRYGAETAARLSSVPRLYYDDAHDPLDEPFLPVPRSGTSLSAERDIAEIQTLITLADEFLSKDLPAVALLDGTLIRWNLANAGNDIQLHLLQPYLEALDALRTRGIPVVAYTSRPRSPEVVGLIRLMYCPDLHLVTDKGAACSVCSGVAAGHLSSCAVLRGLTDAEVLASTLTQGQRGPLFCSLSRINVAHYGEHMVHFFYLHVGREIARVEVPGWVANDPAALERIQALIYDQVMRGQGYPVGLARAHEQAVVRGADRRALRRLVEQVLMRAGLPVASSRKAVSKSRQAL